MIIININYRNESLPQYRILLECFRLFGIPVYDSYSTDDLENDNITYIDPGYDIHLIDLFLGCEKTTDSIFIDELPPVSELGGFFACLMEKIEEKLQFDVFSSGEISKMAELLQKINVIKNWYLPYRMIRSNLELCAEAANTIYRVLSEYELPYTNSDEDKEKYQFIKYAVLNSKLMINRLCKKGKVDLLYSWNDLFDEISKAYVLRAYEKPYALLFGLIYDESEQNNMITEKYYTNCINPYDYYGSYKLARLNEFKYNDNSTAICLLDKAVNVNPQYYRALYKIGLFLDSIKKFSGAFGYYSDAFDFLDERMQKNFYEVRDGQYYIKLAGKIMDLDKFFQDSTMVEYYGTKLKIMSENIRNNSYIEYIAKYAGVENIDAVYEDIRSNYEEHYNKFCKGSLKYDLYEKVNL